MVPNDDKDFIVEAFRLYETGNESNIDMNDAEACVNYCKFFIGNFAKLWISAGLNSKQRFQTLLLPEKLYYDNGTFRTTATALIFKQLQCEMSRESYLVAPTGFEPVFAG